MTSHSKALERFEKSKIDKLADKRLKLKEGSKKDKKVDEKLMNLLKYK
jgi:hypothetical protein